jgi:hypothetical protein
MLIAEPPPHGLVADEVDMWMNLINAAVGMLFSFSAICADVEHSGCTFGKSPENVGRFFANRLNGDEFKEVDLTSRPLAAKLLSNQRLVEIDRAAALSLISNSNWLGDQKVRYYLTLALRATEGGGISVFRDGLTLYVTHGDIGIFECPHVIESAVVVISSDPLNDAISAASVSR